MGVFDLSTYQVISLGSRYKKVCYNTNTARNPDDSLLPQMLLLYELHQSIKSDRKVQKLEGSSDSFPQKSWSKNNFLDTYFFNRIFYV